jgi:hypothetical protein
MARLRELESSGGYVTLQDGTKFRPKNSGISMLFSATKLGRDLGREPILADFSGDEQDQWRCYAKWSPDPAQHGQISILLTNMAKKLVD